VLKRDVSTSAATPPSNARSLPAVGWPTILVALVIYSAFMLVTWFHNRLPVWLLLPLGAYLVAWHGSLQHEVIHGHPTSLPWLNRLLVFPNLVLWLPFEHYRESHIRHHREEWLTDPLEDPESWYLTTARWSESSSWLRSLLWINNTVAGRLLIGPLLILGYFLQSELYALRRGSFHWRAWLINILSCTLVLTWVVVICGLSFWSYLLFFVYPGTSLTLLRSFAEHRARPEPSERTVVVEASLPLALLYLNNNLHAVHHSYPGEPWFRLPEIWKRQKKRLLAQNGNYRFSGYAEIIARYFLWPKEGLIHPASAELTQRWHGDLPIASTPNHLGEGDRATA
jgi:fatty acid desaturase